MKYEVNITITTTENLTYEVEADDAEDIIDMDPNFILEECPIINYGDISTDDFTINSIEPTKE